MCYAKVATTLTLTQHHTSATLCDDAWCPLGRDIIGLSGFTDGLSHRLAAGLLWESLPACLVDLAVIGLVDHSRFGVLLVSLRVHGQAETPHGRSLAFVTLHICITQAP
jgi:hypothetical protein